MKKLALIATTGIGFVLTNVIPAMADKGGDPHNSAPAVDIGSGLLGNVAALAGMSVVLLMLFRRRSRS